LSRRWFVAALSLVALLTALRVALTHRIFSQVIDEPVHIAAGYDWLAGSYTLDIEHPPLARVLVALPLRLVGAPAPAEQNWMRRGTELLLTGGRYERNLALARTGNLIFLMIAIVAVGFWGAHYHGYPAGLIAAGIYSLLPPILGHAGVATTDMAAAAMTPLALLAFARRSKLRGVAIGLGLLAKFSFVIFFAAGALVILAIQRFRPRLLLPIILSVVVVWAGYQFEFDTLERAGYRGLERTQYVFGAPGAWVARHVPLPAPSFLLGLIEVRLHDLRGHDAFLLGEKSREGWWYYFPVALFFKSPLPLLLLFAIGARSSREPALIAMAMLAVAMTASINIGVRHILPLYAPMAIVAAAALRHRAIGSTLVIWLAVNSAVAHPDHIAWFNEAARRPERILADSNLDWGQDVLHLRDAVRERGITELHGALFTSAPLKELGLTIQPGPSNGWVAVSETILAMSGFEGIDGRPYQRIGKTIRLYPPR
jgi:4-amino-4-deoxy-L-arabinose transferase-like glycosyltransferase